MGLVPKVVEAQVRQDQGELGVKKGLSILRMIKMHR
jgi:hypothetical protein